MERHQIGVRLTRGLGAGGDPARAMQVLKRAAPTAVAMGAVQINLLVNTWLATSVFGAPSSLRFAFQLMYLPIGIFGVSVATATIRARRARKLQSAAVSPQRR